jgi:beta-lactamase regulating signal transducer with metallopeptidase domain
MTSTFSGLLNGLLFAGTLTAAVWVALRFVPRRTLNAATRYVIWWVALVCAVALPGAYRIWKSPACHAIPAPHPAILASPANISIAPMDGPALAAVVVPVHVSHPDWVRRLLLLWPAISAMLLLRLALGCLLLNRLKRRGREARPEVQARAAKWLERCAGSRSGVRVLISEDIATPVAAGPRNPAILIPASLYDELSPDDLDRIGCTRARIWPAVTITPCSSNARSRPSSFSIRWSSGFRAAWIWSARSPVTIS